MSLLSQFPQIEFTYIQRPFVDSVDKVEKLVSEINVIAQSENFRPLVFATMPEEKINHLLQQAHCHYYEVFDSFLDKIGNDLQATPVFESGLSHGLVNEKVYDSRIDALNFTLKHDDAMVLKTIGEADVIIVGLSRSGKTPTSLYLALKFGIRAANYPITEDDFERNELPAVLLENRDKIFATKIKAKRLHRIAIILSSTVSPNLFATDNNKERFVKISTTQSTLSMQQLELANQLRTGKGRRRDYYQAVQLYKTVSQQGSAEAQYWLGVMCFDGLGITDDRDDAMHWLALSADQDYPPAKKLLQHLLETDDVSDC